VQREEEEKEEKKKKKKEEEEEEEEKVQVSRDGRSELPVKACGSDMNE